jgi:hypothetical protein
MADHALEPKDQTMAKLYRITPLEKKSVEYFVDVFERMPDGTIRGFDVTETWRWGQGFRDLDEPVYDTETDRVYCQPGLGWGCELDDLCSVYVNFSDGFTEEEKEQIESLLRWETEDDDGRCGTAWLYDGDHNWEIEDDHVAILGPVKIEIIDEDVYNEVTEEVQPTKLEPSNGWPFKTANQEEND